MGRAPVFYYKTSMITPGGAQGRILTRGRAPQTGWTPLHKAVARGHLEMARALLLAGANVAAKDKVSEGGGEAKGRGFEGAEISGDCDRLRRSYTHLPGRNDCFLRRQLDAHAYQCVDVEGSLLHKMHLSGC